MVKIKFQNGKNKKCHFRKIFATFNLCLQEILNQDIGCIQTGQETAIKLDAYNFQDYGKLEGVMVSISPDAIWDEQKGWIYQGKVSINLDKFKQRNPGLEMTVGMEGTVEVKVDERRILDFFLEPIVEHFDGSLKVR